MTKKTPAFLAFLLAALGVLGHARADMLFCIERNGSFKMEQVYNDVVNEKGAARIAQEKGWHCTQNRVYLARADRRLELNPEFTLQGTTSFAFRVKPEDVSRWTLFGKTYQEYWGVYEQQYASKLDNPEKRNAFQRSLEAIALEEMYYAFSDIIAEPARTIEREYRWRFWGALALAIAKAESGRQMLPADSINAETKKLLAVGTWQVAPSTFEGAGFLEGVTQAQFNPYDTTTNAKYFAWELRKKFDRIWPWAQQGYAQWRVSTRNGNGEDATKQLDGVTKQNFIYLLTMAYNWGVAGMLNERLTNKPSNGYPEKVLGYLQQYCPGANTVAMTCSAEPAWYRTALENSARVKGILQRLRQ